MKTPTIPPSSNRPHLRARNRSGVVFGLIAAGSIALGACGSDNAATSKQSNPTSKQSNPTSKQSNPTFTLNEFTIKLDRPSLPQGKVKVTVNNVGREEHELVLVKAASVSDLPTKPDGSIDEEKIPASDKVGEIGHVASHSTNSATFELAPGSYVAFCNIIDQMGPGAMMGSESSKTMTGGSGPMMGSGSASTMMGSGSSSTMMGNTSGHVHFALGMHQLIKVE